MKQETVVLVDRNAYEAMSIREFVAMLIEFGAPILLDPDGVPELYKFTSGECIEVSSYDSVGRTSGPIEIADYIRISDQILYRWVKEVERGPGGITIWIQKDQPPEIITRAEI